MSRSKSKYVEVGCIDVSMNFRKKRERDVSEQQKKTCSPLVLSGEVTLGDYIELLNI